MSREELFTEMLTAMVLEYRVSIDTLSQIFRIEKNDLYNQLISTDNHMIKCALIYVLDYETKNEELIDPRKAKIKAQVFLTEIHLAKNKEDKLKVIRKIHNNQEIQLIAQKKKEDITPEDIDKIINYRYKYALPRGYITKVFDISESIQRTYEAKLDADLQKKLKCLNEYNEASRLVNPNIRIK